MPLEWRQRPSRCHNTVAHPVSTVWTGYWLRLMPVCSRERNRLKAFRFPERRNRPRVLPQSRFLDQSKPVGAQFVHRFILRILGSDASPHGSFT